MSKSMTPERVRDNFVQNLAENACLNMCTTEEMNIVISALEYRTAKKPECEKLTNATIYKCTKCNAIVRMLFVGSCNRPCPNHCDHCGQALDWSDDE